MKVFAFYFISECLDLINMTLPDLPSDFHCRMLDTCTTVDCCVHVNFLQRNIHLELDIDICSRKISFVVEKLKQDLSVFNYTLGM